MYPVNGSEKIAEVNLYLSNSGVELVKQREVHNSFDKFKGINRTNNQNYRQRTNSRPTGIRRTNIYQSTQRPIGS